MNSYKTVGRKEIQIAGSKTLCADLHSNCPHRRLDISSLSSSSSFRHRTNAPQSAVTPILLVHFTLSRHVTYLSTLVAFDTSPVLADVDGGGTLASHVTVTLAFKTPAFRRAISGDMTEALASMALLTSAAAATTAHRAHGESAATAHSAAESSTAAASPYHAYGIWAIAGDMPVFFTVVTIFDGSIFTRFGWLRAFSGNVSVVTAVVTDCAIRTVTGYVTLLVTLVTQTIFGHD